MMQHARFMSDVMSQAKHLPPVHFPHLILPGDQRLCTIASVVGGETLEQERPTETWNSAYRNVIDKSIVSYQLFDAAPRP